MTDLRSALERYLSMRKGFGYKYQHQTRRLADFVSNHGQARGYQYHYEARDGVGDTSDRSACVLGFAADG